jgi:predicted dehydrogenase
MSKQDTLPTDDQYALVAATVADIEAPELPYAPPAIERDIKIALIGCGGIASTHLAAYQSRGWKVVAFCDIDKNRAQSRADQFFPDALVTDNPEEIFALEGLDAIDIATHTRHRPPLLRRAIECGHHVLSQKPFVTDITVGEELIALAKDKGVMLCVNQNGRFAPHFSYIRELVTSGTLGNITGIHTQLHWNHTWIAGTPFAQMRDIVLYDFAIHWFDFVASLLPANVDATVTAFRGAPRVDLGLPALEATAVVEWSGGRATLSFDAGCLYGSGDSTTVIGSEGTVSSTGPDGGTQEVTLNLAAGKAKPELVGKWFNDGFAGTMAELLDSATTGRKARNDAEGNLRSLKLCFAAIESADTGKPVKVGTVLRLPAGAIPDNA